MKINKACDLSSISVLPPHSRRLSGVLPVPQTSQQFRSQSSQLSFSQGMSSQHGIFSQTSQNSLDEVITNDQRFFSQERENPVKPLSSLPPNSYTREYNQMLIPRSSLAASHKWSSASVVDRNCHINEELERRIGVIETSMSRFGMILDSVQGDVIQINKGTKEINLELEGVRQKLSGIDNLLQLMAKGQEDFKDRFHKGLDSVFEKIGKNSYQEKLPEVLLALSTLPEWMETLMVKLQCEICSFFTTEVKATLSILKKFDQKPMEQTLKLPSKDISCSVVSQKSTPPMHNRVQQAVTRESSEVVRCGRKVEMGGWNTVKQDNTSMKTSALFTTATTQQSEETEWCAGIDSDEELDGGFSTLLEASPDTDTGGEWLAEETRVETERMLKYARRRRKLQKRNHHNHIIII